MHPEIEQKSLRTTDVRHTILKPMTVPEGWTDIVIVTDAEKGWYDHKYHQNSPPDILQDNSPPGTFSYADILLKDPELKHLVGHPTIFFSHPRHDEFRKVIKSIAQLGADEFIWFDCAVLDEHATQSFTQDWWGTTFKDAIKVIGHTVMRMSPWHNPITLTRAWCI